jgi:hypothetical protein
MLVADYPYNKITFPIAIVSLIGFFEDPPSLINKIYYSPSKQ